MKKMALLLVLMFCWAAADKAAGEEAAYVGVKKCKVCHIKIYQTWKETKHALAFDKLNEQEKQDAKCNECHVTGKDVTFPGIQCEACHGPGSKFTSATIMNKKKYEANPEGQRKMALEAGLVIAPNEASCKQCHNERSPHYNPFDFKARYEEINHKNK
jgi:RecJ-like exonuclease